MWNIFKLTNFAWLLISTYCWVTAPFNQGPFLIVINVLMVICLSLLPIKIRLDARLGRIAAVITLIALWYIWIDGPIMGVITLLMYLPVLYLLQLPFEYKKDLLEFTTRWYAVIMIPALIIYWLSLFITVPSIGMFLQPGYVPFINHIFYIETTFDYGTLVRFNAFFIEPGHQALLSTFIMIANRYRFKECPWLWVLAAAMLFSFSLAGYVLAAVGFVLLKVNTIFKAVIIGTIGAAIFGLASNWAGGNNAMNELIIRRLEQDDSKGIKGNNRFNDNTDYTYKRAMRYGDLWTGVKDKTNMEIIDGAGFKIYIINYGIIGIILSLLLYLSLIPEHPDRRYTVAFFIVICLCFIQRSYPAWYSWLFPYIVGLYVEKGRKAIQNNQADFD